MTQRVDCFVSFVAVVADSSYSCCCYSWDEEEEDSDSDEDDSFHYCCSWDVLPCCSWEADESCSCVALAFQDSFSFRSFASASAACSYSCYSWRLPFASVAFGVASACSWRSYSYSYAAVA